MSPDYIRKPQQGVALVVALLFLLVVTIISVIAASNSTISLKMSANLADNYASFQSAEAGILAVLSLVGTANDPFLDRGDTSSDPFAGISASNHPLRDLSDGAASVDADVFLSSRTPTCPAEDVERANSTFLLRCVFYRIEAEHEVPKEARTKVELGVIAKFPK